MLYDELVFLIDSKNKIYKELNDSIYSSKTEEEYKQASIRKKHFIHVYSQELYDFLWSRLSELTAKDCIAFDLVPYIVWAQLSERYSIIIDTVKKFK